MEMMMKNLLRDLPEDLFNNMLLSKVHTKSLLSLRCVCRYLRNLITPAFVNKHLHHSNSSSNHHQLNNQLVLIHSNDNVFYSLKFNDGVGGDPCHPGEVILFEYPINFPQIWGSCNGLLCLSSKADDANRVCLWNPTTKEYKDIPPPLPLTEIIPIGFTKLARRLGSITYGFGYDRFIDDYKIIRRENLVGGTNDGDEYYSITEFQVYRLGTNTWRKINTDNNPYKSYFVQPPLYRNETLVFVNGALHWIMSKSSKWPTSTEAVIVSFDIEKEVFRELQKPLIYYKLSLKINVLRGCLCLFEFNIPGNADCFNVWMMMDYGAKESWTKLFTIDRKEVLGSFYNIVPSDYRLLRFCKNGDILIGKYNILFAYDPINNKARRVGVEFGGSVMLGDPLYQSEIYIESLVSLNSGVYKGGERRIRSKMVKGEFDPRLIE